MNAFRTAVTSRVLALASGLALVAHIGFAANAYVAIDGDNGNDGLTPATAVATLSKAVTIATTPGDTIYVGEGTYPSANNINISMPNDVNVVGAGSEKTTFTVTGYDTVLTDLDGNANPNTLYTGFKIDGTGCSIGWDNRAFLYFKYADPKMNATFSNIWFVGPYDGNQLTGVPGTANARNRKGISSDKYGADCAYTGTVTITHCLFERLGMAYGCNDDNNSTSSPYTVYFRYCTFVNCNDTANGTTEASPLTFRGADTNRVYYIDNCVMSHCQRDNTVANKYGLYYQNAPVPPVNVYLGNNLFYTNTIGKGANGTFGDSASKYNGIGNVVVDVEPSYVTVGGKPYSLDTLIGGTKYGWNVIPEPGLAVAGIVCLGMLLGRR